MATNSSYAPHFDLALWSIASDHSEESLFMSMIKGKRSLDAEAKILL